MTSRPANWPGVNQNGWNGGWFSWNSAWTLKQTGQGEGQENLRRFLAFFAARSTRQLSCTLYSLTVRKFGPGECARERARVCVCVCVSCMCGACV